MDLSNTIQIDRPKQLEQIIDTICVGIPTGEFEVVSGDLQWADIIDCGIKHVPTGKTWRLNCERYHGAGGAWEPIKEKETQHHPARYALPRKREDHVLQERICQ